MRNLDNHGRLTLFGVYNECKEDMLSTLKTIPKNKKRAISYRLFSQVVRMYFEVAFKMLIKGSAVPLLNKFGILNVVKTQCIRYNPTTVNFYIDESGKKRSRRLKLKTRSGYWYFVFWDAPKILRQYRFNIDVKYKRAYMKLVEEGYDYLDYTLDGYGRNASVDYIQHIK